ncbi:hypothetical protein T07_15302, partial [Trichinella nelsoni]
MEDLHLQPKRAIMPNWQLHRRKFLQASCKFQSMLQYTSKNNFNDKMDAWRIFTLLLKYNYLTGDTRQVEQSHENTDKYALI